MFTPDLDIIELETYEPTAWDVRISETSLLTLERVLREMPGDLPRIRLAQVLWHQDRYPEALQVLDGVQTAPAPGLRLVILAHMCAYDEVLARDYSPEGYFPCELESDMYAMYARSICFTQTGDPFGGLVALEVALSYAQSLRMRDRVENLMLERRRANLHLGARTPPEARFTPQSLRPKRQAWCVEIGAWEFITEGRYDQALAITHDSEPGHQGVRAFASAMLGSGVGDLSSMPQSDEHVRVARAVWKLRTGRHDVHLAGLTGQLASSYGRLMNAIAQLRTEGGAPLAAALLDDYPVPHADQRAMWALIRWAAHLQGAPHPDPLSLPVRFRANLNNLPEPLPVARFLAEVMPEWVVLAAFCPVPHVAIAELTTDLPLLRGKFVSYRGVEHEMAGRVGRMMVAQEGLGVELDEADYSRTELRRFQATLDGAHLPNPVNLGRVARHLLTMAREAHRRGGEVYAWNNAYEHVLSMLSADVHDTLAVTAVP